jgi:hypothetical protein
MDALHPNNNSESVNVGIEYQLRIPGTGIFSLRGGYKALFMDNSQYGLTGGGGIRLYLMGNRSISIDYAYRTLTVLGNVHSYTIGLDF